MRETVLDLGSTSIRLGQTRTHKKFKLSNVSVVAIAGLKLLIVSKFLMLELFTKTNKCTYEYLEIFN